MNSTGDGERTALLTVFTEAVEAVVSQYKQCSFTPLTEADVQCRVYAEILCKLRGIGMEHVPLHANWRLANRPKSLEKAKHDLIVGHDVIVAEIKFEADYPGVSKPVCFASEIVRDLRRLAAARANGVQSCHMLLIDEDGTHRRNLQKSVPSILVWQDHVRRDGRNASVLHVTI